MNSIRYVLFSTAIHNIFVSEEPDTSMSVTFWN